MHFGSSLVTPDRSLATAGPSDDGWTAVQGMSATAGRYPFIIFRDYCQPPPKAW